MKIANQIHDRYYEVTEDETITHVMLIVRSQWELYRVSSETPNLTYIDRDGFRHDLAERHQIQIK